MKSRVDSPIQVQDGGLSPEELEQARTFWKALMFAPNSAELDAARVAFKAAPQTVQLAVMLVIGREWAQGKDSLAADNPFG